MINVDAGNSPERPENPVELRKTWRVTWMAIAGLVLLIVVFVAIGLMRGRSDEHDGGTQQQRGAGIGERDFSNPPR
jgi:hypothetical protein